MKNAILALLIAAATSSQADAQLFPRIRNYWNKRRAPVHSVPHQAGPSVYVQPMDANRYAAAPTGGYGGDALHIVNQKRAARGLRPLAHNPAMAAAALREANHQARSGHTGHCYPMNASGVKSGTGHATGSNLAGRFTSCYLYDRRATQGGAAIAYANNGRRAHYALMCR